MPRHFRKILRITAFDSPNVRRALAEIRAGLPLSHKEMVPGVVTYEELQKRLATWDPIRIAVGIHAQFYIGIENYLFPPSWLDHAETLARQLGESYRGSYDRVIGKTRKAKAIGIDPGEGVANTAMASVDDLGLIELRSKKTPDTSVIEEDAILFGKETGVPPENWIFDQGGGGKQIADSLRRRGYPCRTVAFGEAVSLDPKYGKRRLRERIEDKEERYVYKNRRAEMYGTLREYINPNGEHGGWALPTHLYPELRLQLAPIPLLRDGEGRMWLPPKNKKSGEAGKKETQKSLTELIGHSPDEADALVLALHGMIHTGRGAVAGPAISTEYQVR